MVIHPDRFCFALLSLVFTYDLFGLLLYTPYCDSDDISLWNEALIRNTLLWWWENHSPGEPNTPECFQLPIRRGRNRWLVFRVNLSRTKIFTFEIRTTVSAFKIGVFIILLTHYCLCRVIRY